MFVIGEFPHSQYRNKEENTEGTEDLFLYRQIFVKSVFVRTIFDCRDKTKFPSLTVVIVFFCEEVRKKEKKTQKGKKKCWQK